MTEAAARNEHSSESDPGPSGACRRTQAKMMKDGIHAAIMPSRNASTAPMNRPATSGAVALQRSAHLLPQASRRHDAQSPFGTKLR